MRPIQRLACGLIPLLLALASPARADTDQKDFSPAERLLLMSDQLHNMTPPATLSYSFRKAGSMEEAFRDTVELRLQRQADGHCCTASGDFLTGARRMPLPDVEQAQGNPVILYFLEHDIRDMQRLTKGNLNYFRKRIRMALYQGASVRDASFHWHGKTVAGKEIVIRPYLDDPNHARFEQFVHKEYVFSLSDAVPGSVVAIRSVVAATDNGAPPLIEEELLLSQAEAPTRVATAPTATPSTPPAKAP